jgi:hypothetical protein
MAQPCVDGRRGFQPTDSFTTCMVVSDQFVQVLLEPVTFGRRTAFKPQPSDAERHPTTFQPVVGLGTLTGAARRFAHHAPGPHHQATGCPGRRRLAPDPRAPAGRGNRRSTPPPWRSVVQSVKLRPASLHNLGQSPGPWYSGRIDRSNGAVQLPPHEAVTMGAGRGSLLSMGNV